MQEKAGRPAGRGRSKRQQEVMNENGSFLSEQSPKERQSFLE